MAIAMLQASIVALGATPEQAAVVANRVAYDLMIWGIINEDFFEKILKTMKGNENGKSKT